MGFADNWRHLQCWQTQRSSFAGARAACGMMGMPSALLQWLPAVLTAAVCNIAPLPTQLTAHPHEVWQQPQLKADALFLITAVFGKGPSSLLGADSRCSQEACP